MRKTILVLSLTLVLLIATVGTAYAITYGEPDNGEHPYVGFLLFYDPTYPGWFSCSGTLLDRNTVLTAGHCTIDVGEDLQLNEDRIGGTDMWVAFVEQVDLSTWPKRAEYVNHPQDLNPDRAKWLDRNPQFIRGTAWPHPNYADFAGFPATYDIGIVELSKRAPVRSYGALADVGTLDKLATRRGLQHDAWVFETSGYGIQEVVPFYMSIDARYKATSMIVNLTSNLTDGYNLHTSNNPSEVWGEGGSCFGDSGGPVMLNDTNILVAVVSFGLNNNCKGADFAFRVDRADSQAFIESYLE